ncbi:hypothetical protein TNCV_449041 [Trichonephila clavipes]|nr:hypothetical protein TNCV_449041 [Trichonephila clavipes]
MRLNENYTFEVLRIDADKTLRLSVAFPVLRIVPGKGFPSFSCGRKAGKGLSQFPFVIKKAILDPRIKADSEPAKLYVREPNCRTLQLKTCDTAIRESAKADFGMVKITKEHGEFGASELTQTRCGITESEPSFYVYSG